MDCYSAESEFIESLDFLSPPVKRISSSRQALGTSYNTDANDVHLLRGFRNKFARIAIDTTKNSKPTAAKYSESSTSLVLKKASEGGGILGQKYSFVSFPSLHQPEKNISPILKSEKKSYTSEKPLIKVTVIPKTDTVQAANLLRRRRYMPKRVQSTTSNHENSIQTKNVYLIVAGRRKEKIYEIKTTGSAKLSTDHDSYTKNEEIPLTELSNIKHLIQSLNMESKKKKEKKAPVAADSSDVQQRTGVDWNYYPNSNKCICVNEQKEAPKKSRVRIFGQFGISEDDKYVLRYGATVSDKQVMSDVTQLTRNFSPGIAETSYGTTKEQPALQQDSGLQAVYNYDLDIEKPPVKEVVSKESQGTQVNFNIQFGASKGRCATFSDKKVQCSCCHNRSQHDTLKDCQSPMVIISVYPKSSPDGLMKSIHYPAINVRSTSPVGLITNTSNHVSKAEKASNKSDTRRNYKSPRISRSPSPVKKVSKSKMQDSLKPPVSEKQSPDHQKALRAIKEKIREKDKLKQDASSRKLPLKLNTRMPSATQVSKNLKNLTVSNATQLSKRKQGTASHATQMANATQCEDALDSLQEIAPIKYSINEAMASQKYPQHKSPPVKGLRTQVSLATQVPKIKKFYSDHATQVTKSDSDPFMISCETQVSKNQPNVIRPRMAKNQETFIANPAQAFKNEQTTRLISKTKAESGTNTDHALAKKALVDTYIKKLTEQMNRRQYIPARLNNSKVTINIDGDRDYYDVLFNRDKVSTDLTIRKTLKDMGSQKFIDEPSLGSLLRLPDCLLERGGFESEIQSPRSPSIVLYNPSEDELPIMKHGSRVTIRDSLEIFHRREDNKSNNNLKNTQTRLRAKLANIGPGESEFLAPIKHFTGDDCSIVDPIERDKQIRELLGVDQIKANYCKTSQVKKKISRQKTLKEGCLHCVMNTVGEMKDENKSAIYQQLILNRNIQVFLQVEQFSKQKPIILSRQQYDKVKKTIQKTICMKKSAHNKRNPLFTKQESSEISIGEVRTKKFKDPAVEPHQQRVKNTESPQQKSKCPGMPRKKAEDQCTATTETKQELKHEKGAQTEPLSCSETNCKHMAKIERRNKSRKPKSNIYTTCGCSSDQSSNSDRAKSKKTKKDRKKQDTKLQTKHHPEIDIECDVRVGDGKVENIRRLSPTKDSSARCVCQDVEKRNETEVKTYVLFNAENTRDNLKNAEEAEHIAHTRKTMSSVEIRYASGAFMKQAAYSSTDIAALSDSSIGHLNSFHTLFRGHRKCATPNLGTSAFSLYSEDVHNSENKCAKLEPQDSKPKKPFLRRLMSCLVMRSTGNSELKLLTGRGPPDLPSVNSSIDSYHISTSLGAMEVSSSIYDTSASFYSNHTIIPVNSKIKRGFFSSVRGFLTNRKS